MSIQNRRQLENTRRKLEHLTQRYEQLRQESATNRRARELTLASLKRMINQFKEEIARFEIRQSVRQ